MGRPADQCASAIIITNGVIDIFLSRQFLQTVSQILLVQQQQTTLRRRSATNPIRFFLPVGIQEGSTWAPVALMAAAFTYCYYYSGEY